jgi:hypothetical protein
MSVNISRPAGGIGLNAGIREYLLDDNGQPRVFENEANAISYLRGFGFSDDELIGIEFPVVKTDVPIISTSKARALIRKTFPGRSQAERFCEYVQSAQFLEDAPNTARAELTKLGFSIPEPEYEKLMSELGATKVQRTAYSRKGGGVRSLWVDSVLKYLTFDLAGDCRQMEKLYPIRSNPIP